MFNILKRKVKKEWSIFCYVIAHRIWINFETTDISGFLGENTMITTNCGKVLSTFLLIYIIYRSKKSFFARFKLKFLDYIFLYFSIAILFQGSSKASTVSVIVAAVGIWEIKTAPKPSINIIPKPPSFSRVLTASGKYLTNKIFSVLYIIWF